MLWKNAGEAVAVAIFAPWLVDSGSGLLFTAGAALAMWAGIEITEIAALDQWRKLHQERLERVVKRGEAIAGDRQMLNQFFLRHPGTMDTFLGTWLPDQLKTRKLALEATIAHMRGNQATLSEGLKRLERPLRHCQRSRTSNCF